MKTQTIQQLKALAKELGIVPTGDKRLKTTWAQALAQSTSTPTPGTDLPKSAGCGSYTSCVRPFQGEAIEDWVKRTGRSGASCGPRNATY